jgi:nitroreductase/NAD-dependent dihydropyrimidine dehydrogenase PreA subunit
MRPGNEDTTRLVTIDPELCRKDGLCVRVCRKVFSQEKEGSVPVVAHAEFCNSCGHCVLVCPTGAIRLAGCVPEMVHPVKSNLIPTYEQVREMVVSRRSTRSFSARAVEREIIEKVINGARFAPSAKNTQSTRFIVILEKSRLAAIAEETARWLGKAALRLNNPLWRKLYRLSGARDAEDITRYIGQFELIAAGMREGRDLILFGAPVVLLFHADRAIRFAEANANLALQNATYIARSLGIGSFYTGYVVTACGHCKAMRRLIELPPGHMVYGGLALGYPLVEFSRWIDRNPPIVTWR